MTASGKDVRAAPAVAALARGALCLLAAATLVGCEAGPGADGESGAAVAEAGGSGGSAPSAGDASGRQDAGAEGERQRINITDLGVNIGDPDASIQVVEFSDFGCPHCRAFHMETYPTLHDEYVETGKVIWKYVPFVLGTFPNSLPAARAGECAIAQNRFPRLRDRLFRTQSEWMSVGDPTDLFVDYSRDVGLDAERFRTCLEEGHREERIRETLAVGRDVGINGTPTFFIQGRVIEGNRPVEFFRQVFDGLLEEQEAEEGAGGGSP